MKTKTWTYIIAATVCIGLSVTFLTAPTPSTAQDGGKATLQPAPEQLITPPETNRALFLFQNQEFATYYQGLGAAYDSVEIVVVSDVDSFLEQAVTRPGWDIVAAFPDPGDRSEPGLVDQLSTILDSISSEQGGVQMLVTELAAPARPKFDVNSIVPAIKPKGSSIDKNLPPLRFEAWIGDSHVIAIFSSDKPHQILAVDDSAKSLLQLGAMLNANRFDFSVPPNVGGPRAPGAPYCCGIVWGACMGTTCNDLCGVLFIPCFFSFVQNPCHSMDGVCGTCPGGSYRCFFLCNDPLCLPPNPLGCDC